MVKTASARNTESETLMPSLNNHASAPKPRSLERSAGRTTSRAVARAYDHAGEDYASYADGEGHEDPSTGQDRFAQADAIV